MPDSVLLSFVRAKSYLRLGNVSANSCCMKKIRTKSNVYKSMKMP